MQMKRKSQLQWKTHVRSVFKETEGPPSKVNRSHHLRRAQKSWTR